MFVAEMCVSLAGPVCLETYRGVRLEVLGRVIRYGAKP